MQKLQTIHPSKPPSLLLSRTKDLLKRLKKYVRKYFQQLGQRKAELMHQRIIHQKEMCRAERLQSMVGTIMYTLTPLNVQGLVSPLGMQHSLPKYMLGIASTEVVDAIAVSGTIPAGTKVLVLKAVSYIGLVVEPYMEEDELEADIMI